MSHISRRTTAMVAKAPLTQAIVALGGVVANTSTLRFYAGQTAKADIVVHHADFKSGYDLGFTKNPATRAYEAVGDFSFMGPAGTKFVDAMVQEYGVQETLIAAAEAGYEVESVETLATGEKRVRLAVMA